MIKKLSIVCLLGISNLFGYEIADSFRYPVLEGIYDDDTQVGWFVAQDYQDCREDVVPKGIKPCRHLGEDWNYYNKDKYENANKNVVAIGNGYVVASGVRRGFAGYIILKHYLDPNDSSNYVLSIYAHLKTSGLPAKGRYFRKGEIISQTASEAEMKKWTKFESHLHFEIRKSKSITGFDDTFLNDGYAYGNGKYYDPTDVKVFDYKTQSFFLPDLNPEKGFVESFPTLSRAKALKLILDKFHISSKNAGFNQTRFGEDIEIPSDVNSNTPYYDYIVSAYNRGIVTGNNGKFEPNRSATLAEFLIMVIRAIPIPMNNPDYIPYDYHQNDWYYKYLKVAYNAGLIEDKDYPFNSPIDKDMANKILDRAYEYFMGPNSGISIYGHWTQKYVDFDVYLYSPYDSDGTEVKYDGNYVITNMSAIRDSGGVVYWHKPSSSWGANLDYDSWGGNGNQPWPGFGEERITVDSQMVRRPGVYKIIFCYYNWNNNNSPQRATIEWWGINRGKNINVGGKNFKTDIDIGTCVYAGTLNTH